MVITEKYLITIKKPFVCPHVIDALSILMNVDKKLIIKKRDGSREVNKWWMAADKKAMILAKKKGYDSITYTKPSAPAIKELQVFNKNQVKLIK